MKSSDKGVAAMSFMFNKGLYKNTFFWLCIQLISVCLVTNVSRAEEVVQVNDGLVLNKDVLTTKDTKDTKEEKEVTPGSSPTPPTSPSPPTPSLTIPSTVVDIPATTVTLQFPEGATVELLVNGVAVDSKLVGKTETNTRTKIVTQTWYGVGLQDGENTITAKIVVNGVESEAVPVKVQVRGTPTQITIRSLETRIPADGRSTATIEGQLLDASGNRSGRDGFVTLKTTDGEFVGEDASPEQPGFQVKAQQGLFRVSLRSSLKAQTVRIQAKLGDVDSFTQLVFETDLRSSIVTGVVDLRLGKRGTDYYQSFRDFLPIDEDNSTELGVRSSVFATGKVGDWLFTGAYNSSRSLNDTCDRTSSLFRDTQFCEQAYPVYGDSSTSQILTPSQDSLYAKFERTAPSGLGGCG